MQIKNKKMKNLENKIIKLRALEPEDIDLLYYWENNVSIWNVSNTLEPFSKYILKKYIENSHKDIYTTKQVRFIIETKPEHKAVGMIDLFDIDIFHKRAGVGILINNTEDRLRTYASNSLQILINYSFEILQIKQLYCNIAENNIASINLFKKHNFRITGIKEKWIKTIDGFIDELFLQKFNHSCV